MPGRRAQVCSNKPSGNGAEITTIATKREGNIALVLGRKADCWGVSGLVNIVMESMDLQPLPVAGHVRGLPASSYRHSPLHESTETKNSRIFGRSEPHRQQTRTRFQRFITAAITRSTQRGRRAWCIRSGPGAFHPGIPARMRKIPSTEPHWPALWRRGRSCSVYF